MPDQRPPITPLTDEECAIYCLRLGAGALRGDPLLPLDHDRRDALLVEHAWLTRDRYDVTDPNPEALMRECQIAAELVPMLLNDCLALSQLIPDTKGA